MQDRLNISIFKFFLFSFESIQNFLRALCFIGHTDDDCYVYELVAFLKYNHNIPYFLSSLQSIIRLFDDWRW